MNKKVVSNKKASLPMKDVAPVWCTDVHSSDYTRLVLKDLQLKSYLGRVLSTAREGSGSEEGVKKVSSSTKATKTTKGGKKESQRREGHYLDGHGSLVEVDRRFDGVQVNVAATGSPSKSMRMSASKGLFQKSLAQCAYPSASSFSSPLSSKKVERSSMAREKGVGFRFRFCGRSLKYPMTFAACLKEDGEARAAYKEQVISSSSSSSSVLSKSSMASAAATFVLRDLSLQFHSHAPQKNPAIIIANMVEELKEDYGVWGTQVVIGSDEVRGMKGVGVLPREASFSRPLLGVRIAVAGRLNGKDRASSIFVSGGRVPRSWRSPRDSGFRSNALEAKGRLGKRALLRSHSGGGLSYADGKVSTRYGILGVKVWLFF